MRIAVCDDEKIIHGQLLKLFNEYRVVRNVEICCDFYFSGEELLRSKLVYDIIFMDYQMNRLNGLETAGKIREYNNETAIIFLSAYSEIAPDSFEVNTFRFLKKPIDTEKLYNALDDYLEKLNDNSALFFNTHDGNMLIKFSDIIYAEADDKYTVIRTASDTYTVKLNLHKVEKMLPQDKFCRCQKSFVVGFSHITGHTNSVIMFDNGEKAQIGKTYLGGFKKSLQEYILRYNLRTR